MALRSLAEGQRAALAVHPPERRAHRVVVQAVVVLPERHPWVAALRAGEAQSPWVAALPVLELEPSRRK